MLISIFNGIAVKDRWIIDFQIAISVCFSQRPHCTGATALGRCPQLASDTWGVHTEQSEGCTAAASKRQSRGPADPGGLGTITSAPEGGGGRQREVRKRHDQRCHAAGSAGGARKAGVSGCVRVLPPPTARSRTPPASMMIRRAAPRPRSESITPPSFISWPSSVQNFTIFLSLCLVLSLTLTLFQEHLKRTLRRSFLCHVFSSITYHNYGL